MSQKAKINAHLQSMYGFVNSLTEFGTADDVWNAEFDIDKTMIDAHTQMPIKRELTDSEMKVYLECRNLISVVHLADEHIRSRDDSQSSLESALRKLSMTHDLMESHVKLLDAAATEGNMIEFRDQLRAGWATYNEAGTREPVTF
ncbi:hypothetical protein [Burkholderia multivorans]|uniref:hypothetical protein n=1 Tax=Burkholderia multivorans TaxID=87883 RepID=UPI001C2788A1|nr:hypothetical protein [Burkholderia multivorans]MBU9547512.1 hypothetical protein [Burkholderia multivorans]